MLRTLYLTLITSLFILSAQATNERQFKVINASNGLADNSAQAVVCTKTGRLIISTMGTINFYNGTTFSHIDPHPDFLYQLPQYKGNSHLYFDRHHHIWLKDKYSVACIDLMQEEYVTKPDSVIQNVFGCQNQVMDIFTDSIGDVWLLTEKGLYGVEQKKYYSVLRDLNLQDLEVCNNMLLTFYENGEEVAQDLETGRTIHRTKAYDWKDAEAYRNSSVMLRYGDGFYQIRNGDTESILLFFDLKALKWDIIMRLPYHMNNMAFEDNGHVLYIASGYGYWSYDTKTKELEHVEKLMLVTGEQLLTDCNAIEFDKQGGLWIGTEKRGLLYARPAASRFTSYTWDMPEAVRFGQMMEHLTQNVTEFNGKKANCMFTDSRNWSWFGTTKGLYMYKTPQSAPVVFNKEKGLLNNVIHAVIEDDDHNIWCSTSCGISCVMFEGDTPVFVNSFNEGDGVPNESFSNNKAMRLDNGTIVMQAHDHVVLFDPRDFDLVNDRKSFKLYPKLFKILVNGNAAIPLQEEEGNIIIDRAVSRVKDISLNANQNSVRLSFSGLNFFRPLQTYYRVRVSGPGIKDEWKVYSHFNSPEIVDEQGCLHLPLVSLKPGDYNIEVQASMFPDVWTTKPFMWIIHVNQPWWRTTGVYIGLLLLLIVILAVNFYYYSKNTKMRVRRNNEEGDMIRKIKSFVERCNGYSSQPLVPAQNEIYSSTTDAKTKLSPEFVSLMQKLIPFVSQHSNSELSMSRLSKEASVDIVELYDIISSNLNKSPRELSKIIRLQKAVALLTESDKSIEQIANECGFYTPNYFIGNFFHEYKLTPLEYREEYKKE